MSEFKNKFSIPPKKNKQSDENVFDFSSSGHAYPPKKKEDKLSYSWKAVSNSEEPSAEKKQPDNEKRLRPSEIAMAEMAMNEKLFKIPDANKTQNFSGQDLTLQKFSKASLENADFSGTDLTGAVFDNACLKGADFSGANLTEVDFSHADLSNAIFSGANLCKTNFTGAKLNGVKLTEANLEEAILLGIEIDELGVEELQALVEYMAIYYPHKLNLTKLNLTLLDLAKIDLTKVSLRGVDFTGCSMKGVKIWELDLSECVISPAQMAEALGYPPSPQEIARLLAPKKNKKKEAKGIDLHDLFYDNGKEFGVWDVTKEKGLDIGKLVESGMKLFRKSPAKPEPSSQGEEIVAQLKEEQLKKNADKARNEEIKERIMQRKEEERRKLTNMKSEFKNELSAEQEQLKSKENKKDQEISLNPKVISRDRGRE